MRRGYTEKPCHGCGSTDMHPTNSVCRECKKAIATVETLKEYAMTAGKDAPKLYSIPEQAHWLPYVRFDETDGDDRRPVQNAFHAVAQSVSAPQDGREIDYNTKLVVFKARSSDEHHHSSGADGYRMLRPSVAKALGHLFDTVRDSLAHAYNEGVEHGRSLLLQLNTGEITTSDFEEQLKRRKA